VTGAGPGPYGRGMVEEVRNALAAMDEIAEPWQPHRLTSVNDYDVKLAKFDGEFVWHTHPDTDEFFLVLAGSITIRLRDRDVELGPHDVFVVPRGVEHCPAAAAAASVLMFEPRSTVNTGDAGGDRTQAVRELS
jgi:mannose-6-phosphate isomerase-like protein (cupin superfamily)